MQGDESVWQRVREGDRSAMGRLFRTHYASLFRYGVRLLANRDIVEDTIQELFLEIWQAGERLAMLHDVTSEKAYLLKSLRYKLQRAQAGETTRPAALTIEPVSNSFEWDWIEEEVERQQQQRLNSALNRLTPRQQEAIHLRYFDQLDYEQIATTMDMGNQAARNLVHRALQALREHLLVLLILLGFALK